MSSRYYKVTDAQAIADWEKHDKKQKEQLKQALLDVGLSGNEDEMFVHVSNSGLIPTKNVYSKIPMPGFMKPAAKLNGEQFVLHRPKGNNKLGKQLKEALEKTKSHNMHTFMQARFNVEDYFSDDHCIYTAKFGYIDDTLVCSAHHKIKVPASWQEITYGELESILGAKDE